jgi:hypothetical protein
MDSMNDERPRSASPRFTIVASVALVVGVALGFGVGYAVGHSGSDSTSKAKSAGTTPRSNLPRNPTAAQTAAAQRLERLLTCMAGHGVKWPRTPGKQPNIAKPPPGVAKATYDDALGKCLFRSTNGTRAPTATTTP